jgi:hypothetical protein
MTNKFALNLASYWWLDEMTPIVHMDCHWNCLLSNHCGDSNLGKQFFCDDRQFFLSMFSSWKRILISNGKF